MHMSSTCRGGGGKEPGPIKGIVEWVHQSREFPPGDGGLTRKRPLGQVGKCKNPLDIYSQTSTNVHLSRLTAASIQEEQAQARAPP